MGQNKILVCGGTSCHSSDAEEIYEQLEAGLAENNLSSDYKIVETGCFGFCEQGPIIVVYNDISKGGTFYCQLEASDIALIISQDLIGGKIVEDLVYTDPKTGEKVYEFEAIDFYKYQQRIALSNCGRIDPVSVEEYQASGGYQALEKVVNSLDPKEVIEEVRTSKLRGRGGGGFPTGVKWDITYDNPETPKYIICNADEGDPGAFMDRSIMEGDPHSVIEGLAIGGYAVGAEQGFVYIRAEYPLAVQRLRKAITNAKKAGILGDDIFGSSFNFDVEIKIGAGAFVCGEETALIQSVEGYRGDPQSKPPYPAQEGLYGQPTLINNVETLADIPIVLDKGGDWYSNIGTVESTGTKVFALAGDINNTGLIEVPMGTSLRKVIFDLGGGIPEGKEFKAAQTGGPSGGCIPKENLDVPLDYDSLLEVGSMMGSGGLIVLDETNCMVDVARFYLDFTQDEACGKCAPGRIGTKRMLELLTKITEGEAQESDLDKLENLAENIKKTALCGLCKSAPNPVLSTLEHFRDEYLAHINDKVCPAGVCSELGNYEISHELCVACSQCEDICPVDAIRGDREEKYTIDPELCIDCGQCADICPVDAIAKV